MSPQPINGSFKEGKSSQTAEWNFVARPTRVTTMAGSYGNRLHFLGGRVGPTPCVSFSFSTKLVWIIKPNLHSTSWNLRQRLIHLLRSPKLSARPCALVSVSCLVQQDARRMTQLFCQCKTYPRISRRPYLRLVSIPRRGRRLSRESFDLLIQPRLSVGICPQILAPVIPQARVRCTSLCSSGGFRSFCTTCYRPLVTRVFMLFEGISVGGLTEARERSLGDTTMWKGIVGVEDSRQNDDNLFRVLEWRFDDYQGQTICSAMGIPTYVTVFHVTIPQW